MELITRLPEGVCFTSQILNYGATIMFAVAYQSDNRLQANDSVFTAFENAVFQLIKTKALPLGGYSKYSEFMRVREMFEENSAPLQHEANQQLFQYQEGKYQRSFKLVSLLKGKRKK